MPATASPDIAYIEEISPGSGRRVAPRAHLNSDSPVLDLCGDWRFRLYPSAGEADAEYPGLDEPFLDGVLEEGRLREDGCERHRCPQQ